MRPLAAVAAVTVAAFAGIVGVAAGSDGHAAPTYAAAVPRTAHARSRTQRTRAETRVSGRGWPPSAGSVTSPRGPYRARPAKLAFDLGGYYGAGTKGLWIDHLKWVGWGQPVAYASGVVHARVWPGHGYVTRAGGIMLDQLRSCGTKPSTYYTSASMLSETVSRKTPNPPRPQSASKRLHRADGHRPRRPLSLRGAAELSALVPPRRRWNVARAIVSLNQAGYRKR